LGFVFPRRALWRSRRLALYYIYAHPALRL